jgi:tetratricopeptide (TPR) repeat protein
MRGQIGESQRWQGRSGQALARVQPGPRNRLMAAFDSAYHEMMYGTRAAAMAHIDRGRAAVSMEELPASERPWGYLGFLGALLEEPALGHEALRGFERDQAGLSNDPVGRRATFEAQVAFAEKRWPDVVTAATTAEQRFSMEPRVASLYRAFAYQSIGQVDSAIASFERFLSLRDPFPRMDATFLAQTLLRLGELYEQKRDKTRAIEYYARFTEMWENADAALQPRVTEIRDRIAKLQSEIG